MLSNMSLTQLCESNLLTHNNTQDFIDCPQQPPQWTQPACPTPHTAPLWARRILSDVTTLNPLIDELCCHLCFGVANVLLAKEELPVEVGKVDGVHVHHMQVGKTHQCQVLQQLTSQAACTCEKKSINCTSHLHSPHDKKQCMSRDDNSLRGLAKRSWS